MADTTPTLREAATKALEALRECELFIRVIGLDSQPAAKVAESARATITAMRAALAEQAADGWCDIGQANKKLRRLLTTAPAAEQAEPVAWREAAGKLGTLRQFLLGWRDSEACKSNGMQEACSEWITGLDDLFEAYDAAPPAPARQEPLTEESVAKALADAGLRADDYKDDGDIMDLIRAVERAHGIRAAQAEGGA